MIVRWCVSVRNWVPNLNVDQRTDNAPRTKLRFFAGVSLAALGAGILSALACGPFFSTDLLTNEDRALFWAPAAIFDRQLARLPLRPQRHPAIPTGPDHREHALPLEIADLRAALTRAGVSEASSAALVEKYSEIRKQLNQYLDQRAEWENLPRWSSGFDEGTRPSPASSPAWPAFHIPPGLPEEFQDYLAGALSWRNPSDVEKAEARAAWERLLERPASVRRYKSTWAAFMLGKYWEKRDPEKAMGYFRSVRSLASRGFADSCGLSAASLGLEARFHLQNSEYGPALELYLDQLAAGDPSATNSLHMTVRQALGRSSSDLQKLAKNPRTQPVVTAYLISCLNPDSYGISPQIDAAETIRWLLAVENAQINDVESAEKLALAAYKANQMTIARRWLLRARKSPFADWLQVKLLLHAGKTEAAIKLLAEIRQFFPLQAPEAQDLSTPWYNDSIMYEENGCSPAAAVHGELGVLKLARREYVEALDNFLRAGFWRDAAYVAERVLTLEEFRAYVDQHWPAMTEEDVAQAGESADHHAPTVSSRDLRYLLARRLARNGDLVSARNYYPREWVIQCDVLRAALENGDSEVLAPEFRATSWLTAAFITRTNGLELLGTELGPDFRVFEGDYELPCPSLRTQGDRPPRVNRPSVDELQRCQASEPEPNLRWHYRYRAAALCWDAAALLPDNYDLTAFILWQGGWWLRNRDPETADAFYKALVRRNPQTELGSEADRRRWFPRLDENGRPIPQSPMAAPLSPEAPETAGPEPAFPPDMETQADPLEPEGLNQFASLAGGIQYVLHKGDSLASIAAASTAAGNPLTVREILSANPELNAARLKVGQVIIIPISGASTPTVQDLKYK